MTCGPPKKYHNICSGTLKLPAEQPKWPGFLLCFGFSGLSPHTLLNSSPVRKERQTAPRGQPSLGTQWEGTGLGVHQLQVSGKAASLGTENLCWSFLRYQADEAQQLGCVNCRKSPTEDAPGRRASGRGACQDHKQLFRNL